MAIYISWKNTLANSPERAVANLFGYLSNRWYPVNVIGSNIYTVFEAYAQELSSASVEVAQTANDLDILQVRATSILYRSTSKIYDNFGGNIGISKLFEQNYDGFNTGSLTQSYRMQIRTLLHASNYATALESILETGQAFTGVTPLVFDHTKYYYGWRLGADLGIVYDVGNNLIVSDRNIPSIGNILPTPLPSSFATGSVFGVTYSVLGVNTVLGSKNYRYQDVEIHMFGSQFVSTSLVGNVNSAIINNLKANLVPNISYHSGYVYTRPSLSTQSVVVPLSINSEFLTNLSPTYSTGASYVGDVLMLPSGYQSNDWYYNWAYIAKNNSYVNLQFRSYASSSIPNEVYYQDFNPIPIDPLPALSTGVNMHYLLQNKNILWDIGNQQNNLVYDTVKSAGAVSTYFLSRNSDRVGIKLISSPGLFYNNTTDFANLTDMEMFYGEMWVSGINSSIGYGVGQILIKHDSAVGDYVDFVTNGYSFGVDFYHEWAFMSYKSSTGSFVTYTRDISGLMHQASTLPHYFVFSFVLNNYKIYIDGV